MISPGTDGEKVACPPVWWLNSPPNRDSPPASFRMKALTFTQRNRALTFMSSDIHAIAPSSAMNFSPRFNETVRCA